MAAKIQEGRRIMNNLDHSVSTVGSEVCHYCVRCRKTNPCHVHFMFTLFLILPVCFPRLFDHQVLKYEEAFKSAEAVISELADR